MRKAILVLSIITFALLIICAVFSIYFYLTATSGQMAHISMISCIKATVAIVALFIAVYMDRKNPCFSNR